VAASSCTRGAELASDLVTTPLPSVQVGWDVSWEINYESIS